MSRKRWLKNQQPSPPGPQCMASQYIILRTHPSHLIPLLQWLKTRKRQSRRQPLPTWKPLLSRPLSQGRSKSHLLLDKEPTPMSQVEIRPSLHRSASHDSLMSISGMDIHLAKRTIASTSQPFQIRGNSAYFPLKPAPARTISASQAMASVTGVSAVSSKRSFSSDTQGPAGRSLQHVAGMPGSVQKTTGTNPGVVAGVGQDGRTKWVGRQEVGCCYDEVYRRLAISYWCTCKTSALRCSAYSSTACAKTKHSRPRQQQWEQHWKSFKDTWY